MRAPFRHTPSVGQAFDRGPNNFDLIRLFAALIVLVSHCYPLSGLRIEPFAHYLGEYDTGGGWGVAIFFVISGFLVTRSALERSRADYARSRLLRILPALLLVSCVESFVIGPLCTTLPLPAYFTSGRTYAHLMNALVFHLRQTLPGTFTANPLPYEVNGSLWTLPVECMFYILLPAAAAVGLLRARAAWLLPCGAALALALGVTFGGWDWDHQGWRLFPGGHAFSVFKEAVYFLAGAGLWVYRARVPHSGALAAACVLLLIACAGRDYRLAAMYVALPYLVIYAALTPPLLARGLARTGDLSYGVYLFAFPVQQATVALRGGIITPLELLAWSLPPCLVLAALSWHFVEKRALRFRRPARATVQSASLREATPAA